MKRHLPDWTAIFLALLLLGLAWFLYGRGGVTGDIELYANQNTHLKSENNNENKKNQKHRNSSLISIASLFERDPKEIEKQPPGENNPDTSLDTVPDVPTDTPTTGDQILPADAPQDIAQNPLPEREDLQENKQNERTLPDRFIYLQQNEYLSNETDSVELFISGDNTITRATATPFLARYGYITDLDIKSGADECAFGDISEKPEQLQKTIIASCGYDLLRGSNGQFIPDRTMTKDELLVTLVRTKTGFLPEDTQPWFRNYFDYARQHNLVGENATLDDFADPVTKQKLAERLYRLSLIQ